ncbi:hypothetical protein K3L72_15720 [Bacillus altitudinis]|uniref:hypothetical protein n=1 Tax=Bacillus TaxID=1386 RepID=UPI00148EE756|nr:hypothetical protein [Bacillus altitudinis]MBY0184635.1 hypothetical protein [Bacillus aerophilus]MCW4359224.1 hypothetical protein [Bacillus altitudinis]MCY7580513.1 hypothetical protein [Bacillus altitudinis]MCY7593835.1 hypothetical protein [Bacillus altitudinis]NOL34042.1 hypothetical protein [Bacillus altitudinis]
MEIEIKNTKTSKTIDIEFDEKKDQIILINKSDESKVIELKACIVGVNEKKCLLDIDFLHHYDEGEYYFCILDLNNGEKKSLYNYDNFKHIFISDVNPFLNMEIFCGETDNLLSLSLVKNGDLVKVEASDFTNKTFNAVLNVSENLNLASFKTYLVLKKRTHPNSYGKYKDDVLVKQLNLQQDVDLYWKVNASIPEVFLSQEKMREIYDFYIRFTDEKKEIDINLKLYNKNFSDQYKYAEFESLNYKLFRTVYNTLSLIIKMETEAIISSIEQTDNTIVISGAILIPLEQEEHKVTRISLLASLGENEFFSICPQVESNNGFFQFNINSEMTKEYEFSEWREMYVQIERETNLFRIPLKFLDFHKQKQQYLIGQKLFEFKKRNDFNSLFKLKQVVGANNVY